MGSAAPTGRTRFAAVLAAGAVELGLALAVIWGLAAHWTAPSARSPSLVTITPTARPTPPPPRSREERAATPAGTRSTAVPVTAPIPPLALSTQRPAAPVAAQGGAVKTGPGAGEGPASGSGDGGSGPGDGAVTPPLRIAGALTDRDYPRGSRVQGAVAIAFRVRGDGRVDRCTVIASSGEPLLDELTCDLIEHRYRYRPALDAEGLPVDATLRTTVTWGMRRRG